MPIYRNREELRANKESWVDIDDFEIFTLGNLDEVAEGEPADRGPAPNAVTHPRETLEFSHHLPGGRFLKPTGPKERIVVLSGEVSFISEHSRVVVQRMGFAEVPPDGAVIRNVMPVIDQGLRASSEVLRISGNWKSSAWQGLFQFGPGRPCDYHYHDADEYWFVHRGHFTLLYEGEEHDMRPGMMLAAGMGEEHGVVAPGEVFEGVGFATHLEGQKRPGHLWRPVHGDPVPVRRSAAAPR